METQPGKNPEEEKLKEIIASAARFDDLYDKIFEVMKKDPEFCSDHETILLIREIEKMGNPKIAEVAKTAVSPFKAITNRHRLRETVIRLVRDLPPKTASEEKLAEIKKRKIEKLQAELIKIKMLLSRYPQAQFLVNKIKEEIQALTQQESQPTKEESPDISLLEGETPSHF